MTETIKEHREVPLFIVDIVLLVTAQFLIGIFMGT